MVPAAFDGFRGWQCDLRVVGLATTVLVLAAVAGCGPLGGKEASGQPRSVTLLNVSYDPTRELWKSLNAAFAADYERQTGVRVTIKQSHGASGSQARSVIDGLEADVVTLALWPDTNAIAKRGLIRAGWESRFPHESLPYYSTIVFVVRKGNPKQIKDWPDLAREGIQIVTPNPKTSGNGKMSLLAAWGSVVLRGGDEAKAREFITTIYRQAPVLDTGARGATTTFSQKQIGDVHLTWESEAHLEVAEAKGQLEIVYPPISIRAEPQVALVDANVARHGTAEVAKAYLEFLYTPQGQQIIGENYYRPIEDEARSRFSHFPDMKLFTLSEIAAGWDEANATFFDDGALFDQIYTAQRQ